MAKKKPIPEIRIVIVGARTVGKYSLGHQFARGWISPKTEGNEVLEPVKLLKLQNVKYEIHVVICKDMESETFANCDGVVLVYSVTDKSSFTFIKTNAFQILHERLSAVAKNRENGASAGDDRPSDQEAAAAAAESDDKKVQEVVESPTGKPADVGLPVPLVMIGNKEDEANISRQVGTEEAEALSKELSCIGFFEAAAICNSNVPKAFQCLLDEIVMNKQSSDKSLELNARQSCCVII